jgi:hypothetical protein
MQNGLTETSPEAREWVTETSPEAQERVETRTKKERGKMTKSRTREQLGLDIYVCIEWLNRKEKKRKEKKKKRKRKGRGNRYQKKRYQFLHTLCKYLDSTLDLESSETPAIMRNPPIVQFLGQGMRERISKDPISDSERFVRSAYMLASKYGYSNEP